MEAQEIYLDFNASTPIAPEKALELDPEYEIAAVNRIGIEKMRERERLEGNIDSVNYYRDYKFRGKKSYIAEILGNVGSLLKR